MQDSPIKKLPLKRQEFSPPKFKQHKSILTRKYSAVVQTFLDEGLLVKSAYLLTVLMANRINPKPTQKVQKVTVKRKAWGKKAFQCSGEITFSE
jgi:hypothetical protein